MAKIKKNKLAKKIRQKKGKNKAKSSSFEFSTKNYEVEKFFNQSNSKIIFYNKLSYFFWSLSILAALFTLIFIGVYELLGHFHIIKTITSPSYLYSQFIAELIAIAILFVELSSGFIKASNKALFIKQNWIAILAILPVGLIARGLRTFELIALLEEFYLFKSFQIIGKLSEFEKIIVSSRFFSVLVELLTRSWYIFSELIFTIIRILRLIK